jgi:hypothetical protein
MIVRSLPENEIASLQVVDPANTAYWPPLPGLTHATALAPTSIVFMFHTLAKNAGTSSEGVTSAHLGFPARIPPEGGILIWAWAGSKSFLLT